MTKLAITSKQVTQCLRDTLCKYDTLINVPVPQKLQFNRLRVNLTQCFLFKKSFIFILGVYVFCLTVHMCPSACLVPWRPEEGLRLPGTGAVDRAMVWVWGLRSGPAASNCRTPTPELGLSKCFLALTGHTLT